MQAGALNRKILVQKRTQVQNETGQVTDSWVDVGSYWAWIKTVNGISAARGLTGSQDGVTVSISPYSFRIRYRPSVTDDMRVVYGGLNFDIKQVRHDLADHDWTDLVCEEGGNDG